MAHFYMEDEVLVFSDCGCKFQTFEDEEGVMRVDPSCDMDEINQECSLTWELFDMGNTKGIFQLESSFAQGFSKNLKPTDIEQLAGLSAILRPGCTQSYRDDDEGKPKTIADHYMDRKNKRETVDYFHPALHDILKDTFGELVYQEQAMQIAQKIAGFDLQQADVLRKAIGKKKADVMAEVKIQFLKGCKEVDIVTSAQADEIFSWIEASQRYGFNKSHAVAYAFNSYLAAYFKAHFKKSFFTSNLWYAKDGQNTFDEIKLLVANAKLMDVNIYPPDFRNSNRYFKRVGDGVFFGFSNIKGVGNSKVDKMFSETQIAESSIGLPRVKWSWTHFLIHLSQGIGKDVVIGLIESGALNYMNVTRSRMAFEFEQFSKLTIKEVAWVKQNVRKAMNLMDIFHQGIENGSGKGHFCSNKKRLEKIKDLVLIVEKPPYNLEDTAVSISKAENNRLGASLTCSPVDGCRNTSQANSTCSDFIKNKSKAKGFLIAAQIDRVSEITSKKGRQMAFISISDTDASTECVIFSDQWEEIQSQNVCVEGNVVMVAGDRDSTRGSLILNKMFQLT